VAIGLMAFFTLVDLFATQAILPSLAKAYNVSPGEMGVAVSSTTIGMAIASLGIAVFGRAIDRRSGIFVSLALLSIPTLLLAYAPNLAVFSGLRIAQGLCMASAFTLTLAYLGESCTATESAGAFAAYITGNVGSNLFGRFMAAAFTDHLGLAMNFWLFAGLNLVGVLLVYFTIDDSPSMRTVPARRGSIWRALAGYLDDPRLRASFLIGFCILFAFIGTFSYVNFVLVRPPIAIGMMSVGFVYFVFAPSMLTTPLAGRAVVRLGARGAMWGALGVAGLGLPFMLAPSLVAVIVGMVFVSAGSFLAQAIATGYVARAVASDPGPASGVYLASYYCGGLAGAASLGWVFDRFGWAACVAGVALAFAVAAVLATRLGDPPSDPRA
jgi:predicted MFS family arabinose efflux permease